LFIACGLPNTFLNEIDTITNGVCLTPDLLWRTLTDCHMLKRYVFFWSLVVSLSGFLFGFDTAVISGAEKSIQIYWGLNAVQHGLTISIALIGTVVGALLGAIPSDRIGRKKTLIVIALLYLVSSLGTSLSTNWYMFLFFRFAGGLGVGASSVTAPIYISEVSPAAKRGGLVALFQFNVVFGILMSYLSNYLIGYTGENPWRLMLGIQAIPSFVFLVLLRFIPESPRWLILHKGRVAEATKTLQIVSPGTYEGDLVAITLAGVQQKEDTDPAPLLSKKYRTPVTLAVLFAVFNQVSGINAIIYYSPRIFEMTGLGKHSSLLSTVGIGAVNFLFTALAINFIDRFGRKTLMLIGSAGLILSLGFVSYAFFTRDFSGNLVTICLLMYIAFFAFSQGAVIWVFISEIFPNAVRAKGQTLGSFTHWAMAALITFSFPYLAEKLGGGDIFAFFSVMMCLQFLFVWKKMPETKGRSLEQMEGALLVH
jgi:sugar porter (SP) family MFS transporter